MTWSWRSLWSKIGRRYAWRHPQAASPGKHGIVAWFNDTKGYGFIRQEDGPDIFVHYTAIQGEGLKVLKAGDEVEFEIGQISQLVLLC